LGIPEPGDHLGWLSAAVELTGSKALEHIPASRFLLERSEIINNAPLNLFYAGSRQFALPCFAGR
jgi:hypothetical protein